STPRRKSTFAETGCGVCDNGAPKPKPCARPSPVPKRNWICFPAVRIPCSRFLFTCFLSQQLRQSCAHSEAHRMGLPATREVGDHESRLHARLSRSECSHRGGCDAENRPTGRKCGRHRVGGHRSEKVFEPG